MNSRPKGFEIKLTLAFVCVELALILTLLLSSSVAQTAQTERPVPILTGSAGFFTNVNGGQTQLVPEINPVILLPWVIDG